jgi:hypothetical protein
VKNAFIALIVLLSVITGMVGATTYSTSSIKGTGQFSASDDLTGLTGDYGGIGQFSYDSVNTQDSEHNETMNTQFVLTAAKGSESFTLAKIKAKDDNGPTSSMVWVSMGSKVSMSAAANLSDSSLSTQVDTQGDYSLWSVAKTFDNSWKSSDSQTIFVAGKNLTVSLFRSATWSVSYVDPDWLCSDCETTIGEVAQPISAAVKYNASKVVYAGIGSAYAAQGVVSSGLQGNGTKL